MKWYQFRHFAHTPAIRKYICRIYIRAANHKPTYFFKVDYNQLFITYPCPFTIPNHQLYLHSINKVDIVSGKTFELSRVLPEKESRWAPLWWNIRFNTLLTRVCQKPSECDPCPPTRYVLLCFIEVLFCHQY